MRAGLDVDLLTAGAGAHDLEQGLLRAQVDDHDGHACDLGDAQQVRDGLGLQRVRAAGGVGRRGGLPRGLVRGDERVDDARVLAVDARDAAVFFQLLQRAEHVLIADHHGGVGHVHLERGDAGGEHGGDLGADGLVPVVDGHVEAIIAARAAIGLFVPEIEAVLQRLALVRAGEVDDHGRAAVDGAARAGVEVVGGGSAADVEVEVRVGVDETREEQLARHVDDGCAVRGQVFADGEDLFALDQHVGRAGSGGGDDGAAFE